MLEKVNLCWLNTPTQGTLWHLILTQANLELMKVQLVDFSFSQLSSDSFFLFSIIISFSKEEKNGKGESHLFIYLPFEEHMLKSFSTFVEVAGLDLTTIS